MSDYYQNVGLRAFAIFCVIVQIFGYVEFSQKIYYVFQLNRYDYVSFLSFITFMSSCLFIIVLHSIRKANYIDIRLSVFVSFINICLLWGAIFAP